MNRRKLLAGAGGLSLGLLGMTSCATLPSTQRNQQSDQSNYKPVKSSEDRVIQTVVGLRPFRPQGYRLESQEVASKTIVHNYGHGGGGISLSWGTSTVAANLAAKNAVRDIAVLGSGVMGLTTALILAQRGFNVTVYAADFPPNTTSNIAAALWLPTSYFDKNIATHMFLQQDLQVIRSSFQRFLHYINRADYGVYWNDYHLLLPTIPDINREQPGGNDLYPELSSTTANNLFNFPYQKRMKAIIIDTSIYLDQIMKDAQIAGSKFKQKTFASLEQVLSLKETVIVNCTGFGARTLFNDTSMIPVQGQLTHLLPQPEINYSYVTPTDEGYIYMFPRKGSLVLGGTSVKDAYSTVPDMALNSRLISAHADLAVKLTS